MHDINVLLKKYNFHPIKYIKNKKTMIIETEEGKYIIKEKKRDNQYIHDYLKTRNFNYIPKVITQPEDKYQITSYVEQCAVPEEQKIIDLILLVSLLHNKTTHYKEIIEDEIKEIYENLDNNIEYLYSYYNDLMTMIESKVYMSPCEYLIARNISRIYESLYFSKEELENWYKLVKDNKKQRYTVIHNNLELDHFIINENKYLISWDKAKIGIPIFDIYKLYKKHALDFEFNEIIKLYEKNYPLKEEERKLLFILISIPPKIEMQESEYENTKEARKKMDYVLKTQLFISPYYSNKRPENNPDKKKNEKNIKSS